MSDTLELTPAELEIAYAMPVNTGGLSIADAADVLMTPVLHGDGHFRFANRRGATRAAGIAVKGLREKMSGSVRNTTGKSGAGARYALSNWGQVKIMRAYEKIIVENT